jgi:hypothetical protein
MLGAANSKGGVNGRLLELRQADDANDAEKAAANVRKFAAEGCGHAAPPPTFGSYISKADRSVIAKGQSCALPLLLLLPPHFWSLLAPP